MNVFTTVTDASGAPVSTLKQEDFQVFEDDRPQKIAVFHRESELPLSIVVAIDTSLSTRGDQKLELESARRFAHAILRPIDGLSLFQFSEIVDQLTPFTADVQSLIGPSTMFIPGRRPRCTTCCIWARTRCWSGVAARSWW